MENGLYQLKKTDNRVEAVYVDQEVIEFAKLNRKIAKRQEAAGLKATQETAKQLRKERCAVKRAMARVRLMMQCICLVSAAALIGFAAYAGMSGTQIATAIAVITLATTCFKLGREFRKR